MRTVPFLIMDITFLVYSNSKYVDVLRILIATLERHLILEASQKPKVIILGDAPISKFMEELRETKLEYIFVEYVEDDGYSAHLLSAAQYLGSQFLYLQDDFFLHEDIKVVEIDQHFHKLSNSPYSLFRLTPTGYRRSLAYLHSFTRPSKLKFDGEWYFLIDYLSVLPACMQATIWKTEIFLEMHHFAAIKNLREEWSPKYREFFKTRRVEGFVSSNTIFPYISVTAVKRGQWNFLDSYFTEKLIVILKREKVNPLDRGIIVSQRRISEPKGSLLKDIWRRMLYSS